MAAIRLLTASVDPPPPSEVNAEYVSLVPARRTALDSRTALAPRTRSLSDIAYPSEDYIWSVSAGDDGSFTFYAVPQKNSGNSAASQWNGFSSAQQSGSGWYACNAIAQYALQASMPTPMNGQLINLYA
jgi:hypothetical protein